jgi:hypothetical protein
VSVDATNGYYYGDGSKLLNTLTTTYGGKVTATNGILTTESTTHLATTVGGVAIGTNVLTSGYKLDVLGNVRIGTAGVSVDATSGYYYGNGSKLTGITINNLAGSVVSADAATGRFYAGRIYPGKEGTADNAIQTSAYITATTDANTGYIRTNALGWATNGSDLAEIIPAAEKVEEGDVLVISASASNTVEKNRRPYDTRLIGVVSTRPGLLMGSDDENKASGVKVAFTGRVPVKVCLEGGPINAGDLLTTSSIPGYAMKATRGGPIVGKALDFFDGSNGKTGKIIVFVNVGWYGGNIEN